MFAQTSQIHEYKGRYTVSFAEKNLTNPSGWNLKVNLKVDYNEDIGFSRLILRPREGVAITPSIIRISEDELEAQTEIDIITDSHSQELGFVFWPWLPDEEHQYETHVTIPSPEKIELCTEAVESGQSEEVHRKIDRQYGEEKRHFSLFEFTTDIRKILDFDTFAKVISDFATINGRYGAQLGRTRAQFFKNMILEQSGGKYHAITSYDDLKRKTQLFDEQESLASVDIDYVLKLVLKETEDEGRLDELATIINEFDIINHHPDILREYQIEFALANHILKHKELSEIAVQQLAISEDVKNYKNAMENAKKGGENSTETAKLWRKLIAPSLDRDRKSLRFVMGRYLDWKARQYGYNDRNLDYIPTLHLAAHKLSTSVGDEKYSQLSAYHHHLRRGFGYLSENHLASAEEAFDQAISIASNETSQWYTARKDLMKTPIMYKTMTEVSGGPIDYEFDEDALTVEFEDDTPDEVKAKLSLIDERIELLQNLFESDEVDYSIVELRAKRFEILAKHRINSQQFDLAIESFNQVVKLYAQIGRETRRNHFITRRKHVAAGLAETQENFREAADYHESIEEDEKYTNSPEQRQYHRIRAKICSAKADLLNNDTETARQRLNEVSEIANKLKYEASDLSLLIQCVNAYQNNQISEIKSILNAVTAESPEGRTYDLGLKFEYRPAIISVLSAQRLKRRGVDSDLLEMFMRVGFSEAFTPESSESLVSDLGLTDISLDSEWRGDLPVYIHTSLEQIEMKENGVTTGDYSDIAQKLMATLEKYLEVYVEYYGKIYTNNWREIITDEPESDLSLGHLARFFQSGETEDLPLSSRDPVKQVFETTVFDKLHLIQARNELSHGHIDTLPRDDYNALKEAVVEIFEAISEEVPIIIEPQSKNDLGSVALYAVELFWSRPRRRTWLESNAHLEIGEVYFLPPESVIQSDEVEIWKASEGDIIKSTERRVKEAIQ